MAALALGTAVPRLHGIGCVAPVLQLLPGGQCLQPASEVSPKDDEKRPDGHGSAADAPSTQYEAASHATHAVLPPFSWYVPAAHLLHEPCSVAFCTVPALHGVGCEVVKSTPTSQVFRGSADVWGDEEEEDHDVEHQALPLAGAAGAEDEQTSSPSLQA